MGSQIKKDEKRGLVREFNPRARPTEKHHLFAREYMSNGRNAAMAYCVVYGRNWKPGDEPTQGQKVTSRRYLNHPKVKKILAEAEDKVMNVTRKVMDKYAVTQERVLEELARVAFGNVTDMVSWDEEKGVVVKKSDELTDDEKSNIAEVTEIETKTGKKIKIKTRDKEKALETLAKHLGLLTERHEHKHLSVNFVIDKG